MPILWIVVCTCRGNVEVQCSIVTLAHIDIFSVVVDLPWSQRWGLAAGNTLVVSLVHSNQKGNTGHS